MGLLKLLIAATAVTPALAGVAYPPLLDSRQLSCSDQGQKQCGSGCIASDWTCCPDGAGGCSPENVCTKGDNDEYGCCPKGQSCSGDGGAVTSHVVPTTIVTTIVSTDSELTSLSTVASTATTAETASTAETVTAGTSTVQVSIWTSWTSVAPASTTVIETSIPIEPFPSRIPNGTATATESGGAGASPSLPVVTAGAAALTRGGAAGGIVAMLAAFLL